MFWIFLPLYLTLNVLKMFHTYRGQCSIFKQREVCYELWSTYHLAFWNIFNFLCKCRGHPICFTWSLSLLPPGWPLNLVFFLFPWVLFAFNACVFGTKENSNLDVNSIILYMFLWILTFSPNSILCLRDSSVLRQLAVVHYCHSCVVFCCMKISQFIFFLLMGI